MGTVSDLSLKSQYLQGPGCIMCDHLLVYNLKEKAIIWMRCNIDDIKKSENPKVLYISYYLNDNVLLNPGNEYKIYYEIYSQYYLNQ